jgi:lipopolysaccharide assembly LptE-like protein
VGRRLLAALLAPGLGLAPLAAGLGLASAGCGYTLSAGLRLKGGAARATVRPFENRSSDPAVGAEVAAALRQELARRGAEGEGAVIDGEVRTEGSAATLPGGATARVAVEARARLTIDGRLVAERTVRREADHLAGADALEGEARRTQTLHRLAAEVARALVDAFQD